MKADISTLHKPDILILRRQPNRGLLSNPRALAYDTRARSLFSRPAQSRAGKAAPLDHCPRVKAVHDVRLDPSDVRHAAESDRSARATSTRPNSDQRNYRRKEWLQLHKQSR